MEPTQNVSEPPRKKPPKPGRVKKLDTDSAKALAALRDRANKKPKGRRIKPSEIIALGLSLIEDHHLLELQDRSLSQKDRLELRHEEYQRSHGKISLDDFYGLLLSGIGSTDSR